MVMAGTNLFTPTTSNAHDAFQARTNDIYLYTMRVVFGNGTDQIVQVNALIQAGGRSSVFDLKGAGHFEFVEVFHAEVGDVELEAGAHSKPARFTAL